MHYQVEIRPKAIKFLNSVPKKDHDRILERIKELSNNPRNDQVIKLVNMENTYRARQGDYRILFKIEDSKLVVEVIEIDHRKDAYR